VGSSCCMSVSARPRPYGASSPRVRIRVPTELSREEWVMYSTRVEYLRGSLLVLRGGGGARTFSEERTVVVVVDS
jgi:hypothetical protein